MNIKVMFFTLCLASAAIACGDDTTPDAIPTAEAAKGRAKELVPIGSPTGAEKTTEGAATFWSIDVAMPNGAVLEVEVLPSGALRELKDFKGPFDYDLVPVAGALSFADAKAKALQAVPGTVVAWKFEIEDGVMEYEFYVKDDSGKLFEIKFDAVTASNLRIVEKAAVD